MLHRSSNSPHTSGRSQSNMPGSAVEDTHSQALPRLSVLSRGIVHSMAQPTSLHEGSGGGGSPVLLEPSSLDEDPSSAIAVVEGSTSPVEDEDDEPSVGGSSEVGEQAVAVIASTVVDIQARQGIERIPR